MDDGPSTLDQDAAPLLAQMYELWVQPELDRRGLKISPEQIGQALVVMSPGGQVAVHLDAEAKLVAEVRATRAIAAGEPVTAEDFDHVQSILPSDIDPDAGWVCFARLGTRTYVFFDFRRNRQRARKLLDRAEEFLAVARLAADGGHRAAAVECAHAAAELAATSHLLLIEDAPPKDHPARRRWWAEWTKLGNAPTEQGRALADLSKRRAAARYGDGSLRIRPAHLEHLMGVVSEMVVTARERVGAPLPEY